MLPTTKASNAKQGETYRTFYIIPYKVLFSLFLPFLIDLKYFFSLLFTYIYFFTYMVFHIFHKCIYLLMSNENKNFKYKLM